jgi:serine/threonine-protein kinase HipA
LRDRRRLPIGTTDPSPLAGVQSKIALTRLADGRLAQPIPGTGAPTTHILKVPDRDHPRDAAHEAATLDLSRALGFETSEAAVVEIGEIEVLLVRRFDRALDRDGRVARLHQEDFAQALGLPAALKYKQRGTPERRFDVAGIRRVLDETTDPIGERDRFIRATLFDLMTGNVDGHAKNFALLHNARDRIQVAPRYDLLPTRLDPNLTDELAFKIGSASSLAAITRADFGAFLESLGVRSAAARRRITERHARSLADGLCAAFGELAGKGMRRFGDLIAANLRQLLPVLGVAIPEAAQERDAFVVRGGGWLTS